MDDKEKEVTEPGQNEEEVAQSLNSNEKSAHIIANVTISLQKLCRNYFLIIFVKTGNNFHDSKINSTELFHVQFELIPQKLWILGWCSLQ